MASPFASPQPLRQPEPQQQAASLRDRAPASEEPAEKRAKVSHAGGAVDSADADAMHDDSASAAAESTAAEFILAPLPPLAAAQHTLRDTQAALSASKFEIDRLQAELALLRAAAGQGSSTTQQQQESAQPAPPPESVPAAAGRSAAASSALHFDVAMADPCMLAMLSTFIPRERIAAMRVCKRWLRVCRSAALWSETGWTMDALNTHQDQNRTFCPSRWIREKAGALAVQSSTFRDPRLFRFVQQFRRVHTLSLTAHPHPSEVQLAPKIGSLTVQARSFLARLRLRSLRLTDVLRVPHMFSLVCAPERGLGDLPVLCRWSSTLERVSVRLANLSSSSVTGTNQLLWFFEALRFVAWPQLQQLALITLRAPRQQQWAPGQPAPPPGWFQFQPGPPPGPINVLPAAAVAAAAVPAPGPANVFPAPVAAAVAVVPAPAVALPAAAAAQAPIQPLPPAGQPAANLIQLQNLPLAAMHPAPVALPPPWMQPNAAPQLAAQGFQEAQEKILALLPGVFTSKRFPALRRLGVFEPGVPAAGTSLLIPFAAAVRTQQMALTHLLLQREANTPHEPRDEALALDFPLTLTHLRLSLPTPAQLSDLGRLSQLQSLAWSHRFLSMGSLEDLLHACLRMPHLRTLSLREVNARVADPLALDPQFTLADFQEPLRELVGRLPLTSLKVTLLNEQLQFHPLHALLSLVDKLPALASLHVDFERIDETVESLIVRAISSAPLLSTLDLQAEFRSMDSLVRQFAFRCGVAHIDDSDPQAERYRVTRNERARADAHIKLMARVEQIAADRSARISSSVAAEAKEGGAGDDAEEEEGGVPSAAALNSWRKIATGVPTTAPVLLRSLSVLQNSAALTRNNLRLLSCLPHLEEFHCRYLSQQRGQAAPMPVLDISSLPLLTGLRTLFLSQISNAQWNNALLHEWTRPGQWPNLETLTIRSCWALCSTSQVDARTGIVRLLDLPRLRSLTLGSEPADAIAFLTQRIAENTAAGRTPVELHATAILMEKLQPVQSAEQEWDDAIAAFSAVDRGRPAPGGF